jgi:hypothetical protein
MTLTAVRERRDTWASGKKTIFVDRRAIVRTFEIPGVFKDLDDQ